ncbi:MAG: hypothetical protein ACI4TI_02715 [Christensenellales bacterium]
MITEQKKLEELMYLSLIGNFAYRQVRDHKEYIAFNAKNADGRLKPIYITTAEPASDKVLTLRVNAFEKRVLDERMLALLDENCKGELNFSKRISVYINNRFALLSEKEQKEEVESYMTNFVYLCRLKLVDNKTFKACTKYMKRQFDANVYSF